MINVAGHRLGTKELESAAIQVEEVAQAAAVPVIDELRGRVVEMYVSLKPGYDGAGVDQKVSLTIDRDIGKVARPKNVWIVADMPKTRSGKIMRRVIAGISNFADVGDVTTLANPEIVEDIRQHVQSEKVARGEEPRELSEQERQAIAASSRVEIYRARWPSSGPPPRAGGTLPRVSCRAVIFDFNGTLSDDEPILYRIYAQLFAEHGRPLAERDYYDRLAGLSDPEIVHRWLGRRDDAEAGREPAGDALPRGGGGRLHDHARGAARCRLRGGTRARSRSSRARPPPRSAR